MARESSLLAHFRGLIRGRKGPMKPPVFARGGGYKTVDAQLNFMVGFMRGRADYRRAHPLGRR